MAKVSLKVDLKSNNPEITIYSEFHEDNASFLHTLDTQGNITGEIPANTRDVHDNETDSEMATSDDTTTGDNPL